MKTLEWGTLLDKAGVPHVLPMYEKDTMQPGHELSTNCNCAAQIRHYPKKVIIIHRVIH